MTNSDPIDLAIIGAGPAALAAAIYTTREDIKTVLFEKEIPGGLVATTDWVENYPGFPEGVSGLDLATKMKEQAEKFGAEIRYGEVMAITASDGLKELETTDGNVKAKTVIIATGSSHRKMKVPGEDEFYGKGVHFCATCDGAFYRDKKLAVVGGGNSAVQEALFLLKYATHIDLLVRSEVKASEILLHKLQKVIDEGKVTVHLKTTVQEVAGEGGKFTGLKLLKDGKDEFLKVDGSFVFIGLVPNTGFLKESAVKLDESGFIATDIHLETSMSGVYAAGDVRSGAEQQIATATGEGVYAALRVSELLDK